MIRHRSLHTFVLGLLIAMSGALSFGHFVLADTSSTQTTINATVPGDAPAVCGDGIVEGDEECDDGGSNGVCPASCSSSCTTNTCGGGGNNPPVISSINVVEDVPTTTITWTATDSDGTVTGCTLDYGLTVAYGNSATVTNVGDDFTAEFETDQYETTYYYEIDCDDNGGKSDTEDGSFTTPEDTTPPGDTTDPEITDIGTSTTQTSATITWTATDNVAVDSCSFAYTIDPGDPYGESGTVTDSYQSVISSLEPNTEYPCRITCVDTSANSASELCSFTTLADTTPPPDVSGFTVTAGDEMNDFEWDTYSAGISDFQEFKIQYRTGTCPLTVDQGLTVGVETEETATTTDTHTGLVNGTTYYYTIFVGDTSGNYSNGVCRNGTPAGVAVCGDGVTEGAEECDDGNVDNNDACTNSCTNAVCGDGILYTGVEQCDSPEFGGNSCTTLGHDGGALGCTGACLFDERSCIDAPPTCGNGSVEGDEECDDGNDNDNDACTNACTDAVCGDGVIYDGFEECDSPEFGGSSCTTFGYDGGPLSCSGACAFDTSACTYGPGGGGEICTNGADDDGDGFIDCADLDCAGDDACVDTPEDPTEICNDGLDNDEDGDIDCADLDCSEEPACSVSGFSCEDGLDNDDDGLIDLADPGCESPEDDDEYNAPPVTVPDEFKLSLDDVSFWIAERTIPVTLVAGSVTSLVGDQLTVGIDEDVLEYTGTTTLRLILDGTTYSLLKQAGTDIYYVDVLFPAVGSYTASIEITNTEAGTDVLNFGVQSLPYGVVNEDDGGALGGVKVSLYNVSAGGELWPASFFRQTNPQNVGGEGAYGYVVPNGKYKLIAEKEGYRTRETLSFTVSNNVVNQTLNLIPVPETITETVEFVADVVQETVADTVEKVAEVADDPIVEEVAEKVVAPTLIGTTIAVVVPSLWSILWPLSRFLFLQPLLLLGRRKRKEWGVVYNSMTKLPVDLAIVRLINPKTKKVMQSRATDAQGRYIFMVEPGQYLVEVVKQGFTYPTNLLAGILNDGRMTDLYHGEVINVENENTAITPNIPVDPVNAKGKSVRRIVVDRYVRLLQHVISIIGIVVTAISFYITPTPLVGGFLAIHIVLYGLFVRYVKPKKPKGWGIVYDVGTKKPLGRAVARLFTKEYDKLVATELTDSKGRYSFLVGPNDYYVKFEKKGYEDNRTRDIALKGKDAVVVKEDVGLKKLGNKKGKSKPNVKGPPAPQEGGDGPDKQK